MNLHSPYSQMRIFSFVTALIVPLACASAQTTWNGGNSGSWNVNGNWTNNAPTGTNTATFFNNPSDAPVAIAVGAGAVAHQLNFSNTGNRSYTFTGERITFLNNGATEARILTANSGQMAAITFNNDIFFSHTTLATSATFNIGGTLPGTSRFSTITFGNILTDAPGEGVGSRTLRLNSYVDSTIILNGKNEASHISFAGDGEVIAGHISALGERAAVQKTSSSTLSLRSDLTITGAANTYSWTQGAHITSIRISETAPGTADRILTMEKRIIATGGGFQWLDNINSTGKLILDLKYSGATAQTGNMLTNASGIVRFSQTGDTNYTSVISGAGEVQKTTGTGTTTLSGANTYTGDTVVSVGTLLLANTGELHFQIGDSGVNNQITGSALGNVTLNGTFTFDLSGASSDSGDSWVIVDLDSLGTVTFNPTFSIAGFNRVGDLWTSGNYQFDQLNGTLSVIPEPASLLLFGLGGGLALLLRRKAALAANSPSVDRQD